MPEYLSCSKLAFNSPQPSLFLDPQPLRRYTPIKITRLIAALQYRNLGYLADNSRNNNL